MTANQIAYWGNVERERSNRVDEEERQRSNLAKEGLTQQQIDETIRNNLFSNRLNTNQLAEVARHNQSDEGIRAMGNEITNRLGVGNIGMRNAENAATLADIQRKQIADDRKWTIDTVDMGRKYFDSILHFAPAAAMAAG